MRARAQAPFRDSQLTRLLQTSLGGNARTGESRGPPHTTAAAADVPEDASFDCADAADDVDASEPSAFGFLTPPTTGSQPESICPLQRSDLGSGCSPLAEASCVGTTRDFRLSGLTFIRMLADGGEVA